MAFNLLKGIEDNTNQNQQRGAAVELGKLGVDTKETDNSRKDSNNGQEDRTGKGNLGENAFEIFGSLFARFDTGDKATVFLHIFSHLIGVDGNCRIEVGEQDNQDKEYQVIPETIEVGKSHPEFRIGIASESHESDGNEHDS